MNFNMNIPGLKDSPVIVADCFHYCRYIHWALDEIRHQVQKELNPYDRKKLKKMRYVLHKNSEKRPT